MSVDAQYPDLLLSSTMLDLSRDLFASLLNIAIESDNCDGYYCLPPHSIQMGMMASGAIYK